MTFFSTLKRWFGLQKTTDVTPTPAPSQEAATSVTTPLAQPILVQPVIVAPAQTTTPVGELAQPAPITPAPAQPEGEVKKSAKTKKPKVAKEPKTVTATAPVKTAKEPKSPNKKKAI